MTLEELFVEKYKNLEEENEKLTITMLEQAKELGELEKKIEEMEKQLYKLREFIKVRTSVYDSSSYMVLDNYIYDNTNKELFDFLNQYVKKDEVEEGEE